MRLAIVETSSSGHHLSYVRILAREALARQYEVSVETTPDAVVSDEGRWHLDSIIRQFPHRFNVTSGHLSSTGRGPTIKVLALRRAIRLAAYDHICVMDADASLARILVEVISYRLRTRFRKQPRITCQIMRAPSGAEHGVIRALIKAALIVFAAAMNVRVLLLVSQQWPLPLNVRALTRLANVVPLVDPVDVSPNLGSVRQERERLGIQESDFVIACVGALGVRKFVAELLVAVEQCSKIGLPVVLLLVGKPDETGRGLIAEVSQKALPWLRVESTYVADRDLDAAIKVADLVSCMYASDLPSGVALKAEALGCRILARAGSRLADVVVNNGRGCVSAPTVPALVAALRREVITRPSPPGSRRLSGAAEFAAGFLQSDLVSADLMPAR